jgi:hypothetical protein
MIVTAAWAYLLPWLGRGNRSGCAVVFAIVAGAEALTVRKPKAIWVEPALDAAIEFRAVTGEGLLGAASFKGLR